MSCYVDKPEWEWRGEMWCHLVADSLPELHAFARQLGLRRSWFQAPPQTRYPHYDITAAKRELALSLGALSADRRTLIEKARALKAEFSPAQTSLF
jgi:hypothetical protein